MASETDMRAAVRDALRATGLFDEVAGTPPEGVGFGASARTAAAVEPFLIDDQDLFDGGPATGAIRRPRLKITFLARDADPDACDDLAQSLIDAARNALNGRPLVPGWNIPDLTKLGNGRWLPRTAPERRVEAEFLFAYEVDGWDGNDATQ